MTSPIPKAIDATPAAIEAQDEEFNSMDESLYEDDLDHEGHWFEIWGED